MAGAVFSRSIVIIYTRTSAFRKTHATNATDASFLSKVPTVTAPSGAGVIELSNEQLQGPNGVKLMFFGAGADNNTLDVRIILWNKIRINQNFEEWVPMPCAQLTCTLSTQTGSANGLDTTNRMVDTIVTHATIPIGTAGKDWDISSPANNIAGHIVIAAKGAMMIEVNFAVVTATDGNCLLGLL